MFIGVALVVFLALLRKHHVARIEAEASAVPEAA